MTVISDPVELQHRIAEEGSRMQSLHYAYHEAGHGVVARLLGSRLVRLDARLCTHDLCGPGVDAAIAMAGPIAAKLAGAYQSGPSESDYTAIWAGATQNGPTAEGDVIKYLNGLRDVVEKALRERWPLVGRIAGFLAEHGEMTAEEFDVFMPLEQ